MGTPKLPYDKIAIGAAIHPHVSVQLSNIDGMIVMLLFLLLSKVFVIIKRVLTFTFATSIVSTVIDDDNDNVATTIDDGIYETRRKNSEMGPRSRPLKVP